LSLLIAEGGRQFGSRSVRSDGAHPWWASCARDDVLV